MGGDCNLVSLELVQRGQELLPTWQRSIRLTGLALQQHERETPPGRTSTCTYCGMGAGLGSGDCPGGSCLRLRRLKRADAWRNEAIPAFSTLLCGFSKQVAALLWS